MGTLPPSRAASRRAWVLKESVRVGWRLRRWEKATGRERRAERVRACRGVSLAEGGEVTRLERTGRSSVRIAVSRTWLACIGSALGVDTEYGGSSIGM